jgi:hypothetical protein
MRSTPIRGPRPEIRIELNIASANGGPQGRPTRSPPAKSCSATRPAAEPEEPSTDSPPAQRASWPQQRALPASTRVATLLLGIILFLASLVPLGDVNLSCVFTPGEMPARCTQLVTKVSELYKLNLVVGNPTSLHVSYD